MKILKKLLRKVQEGETMTCRTLIMTILVMGCLASPVAATSDSKQKRVNVPGEFTGLWAEDCQTSERILILSGYGLLYIEQTKNEAGDVVVADRFTGIEQTSSDSYEIGTEKSNRTIEVSLAEESLKLGPAFESGEEYTLGRCRQLPTRMAAVHGEGINGLLQLDRAVAACETGGRSNCAESLMSVADVSGNSKLSVAELARVLRIAMYMGIVFGSELGASAEEISTPTLASLPLAPLILRPTVSSLDYDADGELSLSEILNDRADVKGLDFSSMKETFPTQSEVQTVADRLKALLRIFSQ